MDLPPAPPIAFTRTILVTAAALYDADGRVLLQEYVKPAYRGYWEFPGGKLEDGETPAAALVRELREELGVITTTNCMQPLSFVSHIYPDIGQIILMLYAVRQWQGAVLGGGTGHDGQKLLWAHPHELRGLNLLPADIPLIDCLS
jgi:8-oxo-dGTP diphosphatase